MSTPERKWWTTFDKIVCNYRFVPVCPEINPFDLNGGNIISHGRPRAGGMSGEISYTLEAKSPIFVGEHHEKKTLEIKDNRGNNQTVLVDEPACIKTDNKTAYVLPGRTVRGMIRSLYRMATFSALGPIDPALITRRHRAYVNFKANQRVPSVGLGETEFSNNRENALKEGVLITTGDGHFVVPIHCTRGSHIESENVDTKDFLEFVQPESGLDYLTALFFEKNNSGKSQWVPFRSNSVKELKAYPLRKLAFTKRGLADDNNYSQVTVDSSARPIPVHDNAFQAFLKTNSHVEARANIAAIRGPELVFFVQGSDDEQNAVVAALGKSGYGPYSFRETAKHTICDIAAETQTSWDARTLDWNRSLFGFVDEEDEKTQRPADALKSRVSFSFACAKPDTAKLFPESENQCLSLPLSGPKPGYIPFYLRKKDAGSKVPADYDQGNAILAGRKRYPVVQAINEAKACLKQFIVHKNQRTEFTTSVKSRSHLRLIEAKDSNTPLEFEGTIKFHNLDPLELGGLLWCLSLGDKNAFTDLGGGRFHSAGKLKALWMGQLQPKDIALKYLFVNPSEKEERTKAVEEKALSDKLQPLISEFEQHMGAWLEQQGAPDAQNNPATLFTEMLKPLVDMVTPITFDEARNIGLRLPDGSSEGDRNLFLQFADLYATVGKLQPLNEEGARNRPEREERIDKLKEGNLLEEIMGLKGSILD